MAIYNNIGGIVDETKEALYEHATSRILHANDEEIACIDYCEDSIHHNLYCLQIQKSAACIMSLLIHRLSGRQNAAVSCSIHRFR